MIKNDNEFYLTYADGVTKVVYELSKDEIDLQDLEAVDLSKSNIKFLPNVFKCCKTLKSVILPEAVEEIEEGA